MILFLRKHSYRVFQAGARVFALLIPTRFWYSAVLHICRLQALFLRPLIAISPYRGDRRGSVLVAWLMNSWMPQLTAFHRSFPMSLRSTGDQIVHQAALNPKGFVVCSGHLPLVQCVLRSLTDMGHPPTAVVSREKGSNEGKYWVWGLGKSLPAMVPGRDVLIKVRTILRNGGSVAALVDRGISRTFHHNIFHLIRSLGAQVVFATVALQPDGEILVEYFAPPDPFFSTDETISINLQALQSGIDRALMPSSTLTAAPVLPAKNITPESGAHFSSPDSILRSDTEASNR
jgi:hypothetical protein